MKDIKNTTIVAINDTPDQLELLAVILRDVGYRVLTAESAATGFEIARRELPDLIVSDVMMPGTNGIELCRMIRADDKLNTVPILLVSALRKDAANVVEGLKSGADDYIESPCDPLNLAARTSRLIERKRMADILRESEKRFRLLIENTSDIISILAPDGTILYESPSIEIMLGYKPEELVGKNAFDLIHPEDSAKIEIYFKESIEQSENAGTVEYRFLHKNNSWRILESIGKQFIDPAEGLVRIINTRDITGQRKALAAQRESESRFRVIFDEAAIGMALVDAHGHPVQTNAALEQMLGYTGRELRKMSFAEFTHPEDAAKDLALAQEVFAGKLENYRIEKRYIKKNGEIMWGNLTASAIRLSGTENSLMIGMVEDITDRKRADAALRESEERFRTQYKGVPIPTCTWKKIGDDFILVDFNDAATEITEGKIVDLIGTTAVDMYAEAPHIIEDFKRCFNEKTTVKRDTLFKFITTGDEKHLDITCVFVSPDIVMVHYRDVTAQIKAEEGLRKSEERFQLAARATNDALWDWDLTTGSVWYSDACYKLLGYERREGEATLQLWTDAIHPDDKERILKNSRAIVQSRKNYWMDEYRLLTADGSYAYILDRSYIIYENDAPVRMIGAAQNITDRKLAEDSLRESERRFRQLIELSPDAVMVHCGGIIIFHNSACAELLGASDASEINGKPMLDFLHENYRDFVSKRIERVIEGEKAPFAEEQYVRVDGTVVDVEVSGKPFVYNDMMSVLVVARDITKRKKAEEAVIEANERAIREYDRLLQRLSTLAQKTGAARDLSTIFGALLDFARASVPCSALFISLYDEEKAVRKAIYLWYNGKEMDISGMEPIRVGNGHSGKAIKSGEVTIINDFLNTITTKTTYVNIGFDEDERKPLSTIVAPMKMMGKVIGAVEVQSYELNAYAEEHASAMKMAAGIAANAIENVRLFEQEQNRAEQLRQSQKLESVGRLAGGIAHDFNNMLTAINGYSDLTLRRLSDDDPLRLNIEEIKKAGERSAALTHQLLAFSRRQVLKPKIVDINHTVTETGMMLKRLLGEDIQLVTNLSPKLGRVEADPGQLTQVIMNLAVNARDAMPAGGELTIETANVFLDEEYAARHISARAGSYVVLSVSDRGAGMDRETLQHIFEPFYTTKEMGKGTGLGLATVYGIVKQSGGYIWVYSEENAGTVFKIYLPRIDEETDSTDEGGASEETLKGTETILLVEDEDLVRNLSRQILEACGYKVIEARDGAEALSISEKPGFNVDLVVTDVVMPKISGRQLAEQLAVSRPGTKFLYMSGYTDDAMVRQGIIASGSNFIQKPFTFNALAAKVRELLDAKTE